MRTPGGCAQRGGGTHAPLGAKAGVIQRPNPPGPSCRMPTCPILGVPLGPCPSLAEAAATPPPGANPVSQA